jgi:hypothetical protein
MALTGSWYGATEASCEQGLLNWKEFTRTPLSLILHDSWRWQTSSYIPKCRIIQRSRVRCRRRLESYRGLYESLIPMLHRNGRGKPSSLATIWTKGCYLGGNAAGALTVKSAPSIDEVNNIHPCTFWYHRSADVRSHMRASQLSVARSAQMPVRCVRSMVRLMVRETGAVCSYTRPMQITSQGRSSTDKAVQWGKRK